jgi:PASTA domain
MADGQVKVPIIGETNKSTLFIAGLAGVTALGWAWWKQHKQAKTATTATTTNPSGASPYGYAYGYGAYAYQPYGYGFGPEGLGAYGGTGDYGYGYYGAGEPVNEEVPAAAATNAQWSEAAMTALTSAGWTGSDVLTALGLYLTGAPVSSTQAGIIQAAIAAEGYPPAPGASGYPPAINQSQTPPGQSGTTSASQVTVPNVTNMTADNAIAILKKSGLNGTISLDANSNKPGIFHIITKTQPPAGTSVATGSNVILYYRDTTTASGTAT